MKRIKPQKLAGPIALPLKFRFDQVGRLAHPWRSSHLRSHQKPGGSDRKVKLAATVLLPPVLIDLDHFPLLRSYGCSTIPHRMSSALIVIALIFTELVLHVSRRPGKYLQSKFL